MKHTKRLIALLLALVTVLPSLPLSISASETSETVGIVADTYISATDKAGAYGAADELYIDNQRTYFATFKSADILGAGKHYFNLPLSGAGKQTVSVYLLDGYEVDESALCYNNAPKLSDDKLVGTYTVEEGNNAIDLLDIAEKVKGKYFTLAVSGSAHYFKLDFEGYSEGDTVSKQNVSNWERCYSSDYVWRTGGATPDMTVMKNPDGSDDMVACVTSGQTYNRIRWYNTFVRDKDYLDVNDIGRVFEMSFDLRIKGASASSDLKIGYDLDVSAGVSSTYPAAPSAAETWMTETRTFTIKESDIIKNGATTKRGLLNFTLTGTAGNTYYFDDITVKEKAPTALAANSAYITTEAIDESGIVADTYVTAFKPDFAFGKDDRLLLNGGEDESIIFVTYSSKAVKGGSNIQLTLPAIEGDSVEAEILLLDGYYVNEAGLTYNTMPDLSKAVSLGEYALTGGLNVVEAEDAVKNIKSDYFTVVLRTDDDFELVLYNDFEDYFVGADVNTYSHNATDSTATDASGNKYTYYYAHVADGVNPATSIARQGGALSSIGNILKDPDGSGNQTVDIQLNTSTDHTYNGRMKLYNSISDSAMTEDSPLIGQTFRFTAKIKAGNEAAIINKCTAFASSMLSAGGNPINDASGAAVKSNVINVSNEWQTVTVDYTVRKEDIKADAVASNKPAWGYPVFTIDFSNTNASNAFLIDDLEVIKLNNDGSVSRLTFASSEGAKKGGNTIGVRSRNAKDPVADTYISAENKTGIFGLESKLYADSQRTSLISFKTADFLGTEMAYLKLPLSGENSQTVYVYLIDGFKVDEGATNYNNAPALTDDMLIGTCEVTAGVCRIDFLEALSRVEGDYFTVAVKGSAHYFEENFESYTVGNSLRVFEANTAYSDADASALKSGGNSGVCSTENFVWRTGGATNPIYSAKDPANSSNKVAKVQSCYSYNRIKWYNSFVRDGKFYFDASDLGKTFNISYDVRIDIPDGVVPKTIRAHHEMSKGATNSFYGGKDTAVTAATWTTVKDSYTVTQDMIDTNSGLLCFVLNSTVTTIDGKTPAEINSKDTSTSKFDYYFDDIIVSEIAPTALASLDGNGENAAIVTGTEVIADTYVSAAHPDTCYGNEDTLRFGDAGGDKKALVLSFMNDVLDDKNYVELKLNNVGEGLKDVYVYYVLDYCAVETSLTWNTMPDYEDNLLGVYDINTGANQIDLFALKEKLTGEYFTLVFRTENHTYFEDFESYSDNYTYGKYDNNVAVSEGSTVKYYYNFASVTGKSRHNGVLDTRNVITDPENEDNKILSVSTAGTQNYDGLMKFYNTVSDRLITKDSDIVGKTFRFTAKIKLDADNSDTTKPTTIDVTAGAYTSYNNKLRGDNKSVVGYNDIKDDWATLTVDYTVLADHIMEQVYNNDNTEYHYSYPMFGLYFGDDNTKEGQNTYYVDNLSVVEVVDGTAVGDAVFDEGDIGFVSALNGNTTVIETTASSATVGDVISFVDNGNVYSILRAENGKLMFGDTVICDEAGNDIVLTETPVKVVAIYDDAKGTARFSVGDFLAYYKDAEGVHATFEHLVIEGGISDGASFGVKGLKPSKLQHLTSEIVGFQINDIERAVRFVSGVDTVYYNAVGFKLETTSKTKTLGSTTVYSSIVGDDKDIYASDYGYNFMAAISIADVKNGGVVKVTPFLRIGENYIYGEAVFYKIMIDGKIKVVETSADDIGAETNADLVSVSVDGAPVVGFSPDVTEYTVPASDPSAFAVEAVSARSEATVSVTQNRNVATVTVTAFDGRTQKVYTFTAYEKVESAVVNKNGANAIVTYIFDDGNTSSASIVTELADKYPSFTGSFALITKNLATLSTIEGKEGDGLLEYEFDENGNYVYTKNESVWKFWDDLFDKYGERGLEGVSHTHTHAYIGENDNGGAFEYRNTNGEVITSAVFPIGNVRKEYYASNQILRELGQRALVMVGAGLTANGYKVDYTESYKALPRTSGAFIGKRTTVNSPTKPQNMVNLATDFLSEDNRFNVKAYMIQHYATSAEAPKSTSADNYSKEACLNAGITYWTDYIDKAVEMGEWAAFCFHNVVRDTHTRTDGHFVFESQADAMFKYTDDLAKENKVWVANFTDACLYMFERSTAEVGAYIDANGNVVVDLNDKEDDTVFTMPLTVKVALPEGKSSLSLDGNALDTFTENEKTYVYVDIVPGNSVTLVAE